MKNMKKIKKIKKPKMVYQHDKSYNYHDVIDYLKQETGRDPDDWTARHSKKVSERKEGDEFQCFWHTVIEKYYLENNSFFYLELEEEFFDKDWEKEIIRELKKLFPGEDELYCYVSW